MASVTDNLGACDKAQQNANNQCSDNSKARNIRTLQALMFSRVHKEECLLEHRRRSLMLVMLLTIGVFVTIALLAFGVMKDTVLGDFWGFFKLALSFYVMVWSLLKAIQIGVLAIGLLFIKTTKYKTKP